MTWSHAVWYLSRGSATAALIALSLALALGQLLSSGYRSRHWPRAASNNVHRALSITASLLIALHVSTILADAYLPFRLVDAVIPFQAPYRSLYVGLGTTAFDLTVLVLLATALRRRIGYARWKRVHRLAYVIWPLAIVHGLGAGTDATASWLRGVSVTCVVLVTTAAARRAGLERWSALGAGAASALGVLILSVALSPPPTGATRAGASPPRALVSNEPVSFAWTATHTDVSEALTLVGGGPPRGGVRFRMDAVVDGARVTRGLVQVADRDGVLCRGPVDSLTYQGFGARCGAHRLTVVFGTVTTGVGSGSLTLT